MNGKQGKVIIMKKINIINIGLFMILPSFIFSIFLFYVIGRSIHNIVSSDKNESEVVVEYPKIIDGGIIGNLKIYYENQYEGKIEKIEDNKIYFMVDKKGKKLEGITTIYKDVEDYQVVFDLDSYTLEYDPLDKDYSVTIDKDYKSLPTFQPVYYDGDYLTCDSKNFHSADELEFLVGEELTVCESMTEHCRTGITNKFLNFSSK
jgi:hypothetical protein